MTSVAFRKATEADIDAVEAIFDAIHSQEEAGDVTIGWDRAVYPTRQTALDALALGELFVEVVDGDDGGAISAGEIVAAARLNKEQVPEYADAAWEYPAPDDQVMVMHTLVVRPDLGGHGFGPRFVDFYERYALEQGCPFLRIDTNARNVRARRLYGKLGYKEVDIVPCVFNGIPDVQLVCLEKRLGLDS